ncbi:aminoglycoside phosphotransferase family protein [Micromonospora cathayae]|uniref:Aminoglycoside phosphotransferase family protein n=1 Tax=Micromonospora cathayae TaxID=3028804 RepID=A0ABY7ZQ90_9ACTN|nr:aminoglycoside phosphotransferase family protein [Micromonospora sp. HUAS 3]WDZ85065.1 aminoglycoside phosphotransferase family protein [Micromonospora sp. HUAS 3]
MSGQLWIPEALGWVREAPAGREWLAGLPDRLAACAERWQLRLGPAYDGGVASLALRADLPDGTPAVLKLQYPDPDSVHEATALAAWAGDGAVRLLAHEPTWRALLVERCLPGEPLRHRPPEEALGVVVDLLPRLWLPVDGPTAAGVAVAGITPLAEEAAGWVERMPGNWERAGRPYDRRLLDAARDLLADLVPTQGGQVLVNQDLHAGNVLRADREPWLVIDPKPLVGEREFGVVPMVRGAELGHSPAAVRYRLDRLTAELGLDRDRVRGWTIGQTLAWSIGAGQVFPQQVEVVRWLLDGS